MPDPASTPTTQPNDQTYPRKWWILVAVGLSLFMGSVDGTIVNIALPTLTRELYPEFAVVQWVVLSFLLGLVMLMLSMGRLGDMIGKKAVFASGLVVFVLGSLLCGAAPSIYWLIAFRFVQSIGAAMMLALGVAIVTETWPPYERGQAIGIAGGIISLGIVAGPMLGGVILQNLSWRWIFYVNLPVGAIALVIVLFVMPRLKPTAAAGTFDWPGALTAGAALFSFALAMTLSQRRGFASPWVLALLALAALLLVVFIWVEQRHPHPMIDLNLLKNPDFSLNLFNGFLTFVAIAGVVLFLPFYLEQVLALPQQQVGLLMGVVPLVLGIMGPLAGAISDRVGTRPVIVVGLAFLLTGYVALTRLSASGSQAMFLLLLLPVGLGMGIFQSPNNTAIMSTAPRDRLGVASGILSMTRTLGQITGIALLGAFFINRLQVHAGRAVAIHEAAADVFVQAMRDQLWLVSGMIALALLLAIQRWRQEQ
ncbi:MAG: MFS transporter [Chloroflexi bacterium]|nr:MFS transporter [Chloroflexota bacterium]